MLYQGATPVFADVSPDTLNLDPELAAARDHVANPGDSPGGLCRASRRPDADSGTGRAAWTGGDRGCLLTLWAPNTKAVAVGSMAHMTVFSFHPVKHITTGEGGMVTTDNPKFAETLRRFRNHGISSDARQRQSAGQWHYEMVLLGFNYRLTDIACALGIQQLKKLDANLARRREIAARYAAAFREIPEVIPPAVRDEVNPAWHLYPIRLDRAKAEGGPRPDVSRHCARKISA